MAKVLDVRPLGKEHWAQFKSLRLTAIATSPSAIWPTQEEEAARSAQEVQTRIEANGQQAVFGAFDGERLVAIAGLRRESLQQVAHKATVWGVFVHPEHRGEGIARLLLSHLVARARDLGVLQIQLSVNASNGPAQALYRSLGFTAYGLERRAMRIGNSFHDEEHMVLQLDAAKTS
jgi:ribosomal protein S18 acetylase RimI-like enzyme